MAIELPHEVAVVLNFMGVPYPDVKEEDIRVLADQVRLFNRNVANTHNQASGAINDMGSVYSGYSYESLVAAWGAMSSTHMAKLDEICELVASALDIAADVIATIKQAVIIELAALVVSFFALPATAGWVSVAARKLVQQMEQSIIGYLAAEVIGKAIEPFEQAIQDMVAGFAYNATRDFLDVPPAQSSPRDLRIDTNEVLRYAGLLDNFADDILQHGLDFQEEVAKLDFVMPGRLDDADGHDPLLNLPNTRFPLEPSPTFGREFLPTTVSNLQPDHTVMTAEPPNSDWEPATGMATNAGQPVAEPSRGGAPAGGAGVESPAGMPAVLDGPPPGPPGPPGPGGGPAGGAGVESPAGMPAVLDGPPSGPPGPGGGPAGGAGVESPAGMPAVLDGPPPGPPGPPGPSTPAISAGVGVPDARTDGGFTGPQQPGQQGGGSASPARGTSPWAAARNRGGAAKQMPTVVVAESALPAPTAATSTLQPGKTPWTKQTSRRTSDETVSAPSSETPPRTPEQPGAVIDTRAEAPEETVQVRPTITALDAGRR